MNPKNITLNKQQTAVNITRKKKVLFKCPYCKKQILVIPSIARRAKSCGCRKGNRS